MSFPRYERYKDSGVEWLGEVPEHWEICSLRHCLEDVFNGLTCDQIDPTESSVPVTRIEPISTGLINRDKVGFIRSEEARENRKLLAGDILFSNINSLPMVGNCALFEGGEELYAGMNLLVLRSSHKINSKWLYCLIRSDLFRSEVEANAKPAINQASISQASLKNISIPRSTDSEQVAIATFLNKETAKIDALIEEQRRLIELLKEKRQAVISHAVDKGLHPKTQRKSWKLKHLIKSIEQGWSPQCDNTTAEDGEWAVLKVGSVNYGIFNPKENKALPPDIEPIPSLGITKDDVLISRANTRELVGSAAVAEHDYPRHLLCDKIYRLKVRSNLCLAQYIGKFLGTPAVRSFIEATATGASQSMVNIGQDVIRELPISLPALSEQRAIIGYLKTQEEVFANLTGEATRAVALLQERRSALISAAVSGKIDVRNYIPKEAA